MKRNTSIEKFGVPKPIPSLPAIAAHESFYEVDFLSLMKFKFSLTFLHSFSLFPTFNNTRLTDCKWQVLPVFSAANRSDTI